MLKIKIITGHDQDYVEEKTNAFIRDHVKPHCVKDIKLQYGVKPYPVTGEGIDWYVITVIYDN